MEHYDYVEWILYKKGLLDTEIQEKMEEHLTLCDKCMEIFLSLIDEEDLDIAKNFIPKDFNEKMLKTIGNIRPISINKHRVRKSDFLLYYTAVASVVIIFTASGFFTRIIDNVPNIKADKYISDASNRRNILYDFSEQITNKTSIFINDFNLNKNKEGKQ